VEQVKKNPSAGQEAGQVLLTCGILNKILALQKPEKGLDRIFEAC